MSSLESTIGMTITAIIEVIATAIDVTVRTVRDHALASCFIPQALFDE